MDGVCRVESKIPVLTDTGNRAHLARPDTRGRHVALMKTSGTLAREPAVVDGDG